MNGKPWRSIPRQALKDVESIATSEGGCGCMTRVERHCTVESRDASIANVNWCILLEKVVRRAELRAMELRTQRYYTHFEL